MDNVVRLHEWPGGIVCIDCDRPMVDGESYSERLLAMTDCAGGCSIPIVEIVCVPCALRTAVASA